MFANERGNDMEEMISTGKAAKLLGVHPLTVARYVDLGILEGMRTPGGTRRVNRESVEKITRTRVSSTVTIIEAG